MHPRLKNANLRPITAYNVSTVRVSKKIQLYIANKNSTRALQRAIDKVRTLPLTPQMVPQKSNLSFKNKFLYISVIDEASDFKFGMQLGFAKAHHKFTPRWCEWAWHWARGAPQNVAVIL